MLINIETAKTLIIERSRQLVKKLVEKRGHDTPPFLSEEYANLLGIMRVEKVDLGRASGILIRLPRGPIIKVNQSHNKARQNFSCAHEIAHNLLRELKIELDTECVSYRTFDPQARGRYVSKVRERLCEAAAAELLMPEQVFRKFLTSFGVSMRAVELLSNIFKVSIRSSAWRIAEVSLDPTIALLWEPQLKGKSQMLRMDWCVSPGIEKGKPRYMPVNNIVRPPSLLHKAYESDGIIKSYKKFRQGNSIERIPMESKGFGYGETRRVISLAFPAR